MLKATHLDGLLEVKSSGSAMFPFWAKMQPHLQSITGRFP